MEILELNQLTQNPELELMEEQLQTQIISQEIQSQCPCKCHPHALSCVKCNEAYHRIPIPRHSPADWNEELRCYVA